MGDFLSIDKWLGELGQSCLDRILISQLLPEYRPEPLFACIVLLLSYQSCRKLEGAAHETGFLVR